MNYKYGEEISYHRELLKAEDKEQLQLFCCGNEKIDNHIKNDLIKNDSITDTDGLYYKYINNKTEEIIAVISLASSGIIYEVDNYIEIFPAFKIDILAVNKSYQKLHYNLDSSSSDEHYYFSDEILGDIICRCKEIAEEHIYAAYIVVYADIKAQRFYERNGFIEFEKYMKSEQNMQIKKNIPMFLGLNI